MRKLLALLLACVLTAGLVGCGRTPPPEEDTAADPAMIPEQDRPAPDRLPPE